MPTEPLDSPQPPSRLGTRDRLRRAWYLLRVDFFLETTALVGKRDRQRILASLRADIDTEAMQHGLTTTLSGLGTPRALALGYGDEPFESRPRWSIGGIVAGITLLLYWGVFFSYALGMLAVVDQHDLGEAHSRFFFVDVTTFSHHDGIGIEWTSAWAWLIVPIALVGTVFLVSSRAWRALGKRTRRTPQNP